MLTNIINYHYSCNCCIINPRINDFVSSGNNKLDYFWLVLTTVLLTTLWFIFFKKPGDSHVGHIVLVVKSELKKQGTAQSDIEAFIGSSAFLNDLKSSNLKQSDEISAARIVFNFNEALAIKLAKDRKSKA